MPKIIIYTDGSSKGNPGPGGYGAIIIEERATGEESRVKEIGGREEMTTNNRMELMAGIEALKSISAIRQVRQAHCRQAQGDNEGVVIEIHTDSQYLMNGITIWIKNWQRNNWRTKNKKEVLNQDLWQQLLELTEGRQIEWKKVLGHSGHKWNDRCDKIATGFADGEQMVLYDGPAQSYSV